MHSSTTLSDMFFDMLIDICEWQDMIATNDEKLAVYTEDELVIIKGIVEGYNKAIYELGSRHDKS